MKKTAVVLVSLLVVACASSPKSDSSQAKNISSTESANVSSTAQADTAADIALRKLAAERQQLESQSDYFDFNKFAIKPEFQQVIQKEAEFIKGHKNDVITLEGNADERGSEGYNHDLAQKRAIAVQKNLEHLGVPQSQIRIISLGKDKPRLLCHEEKCWKENRRVDFIHKLS